METTNTSRADRVQANLNFTCQAIKDNKTQPVETSLGIISQCQIDISYTLASMLDEMRENKVKSIPLDKVKQTREKIEKLRDEEIITDQRSEAPMEQYITEVGEGLELALDVLDKLIESEGENDN